jgi:putative hemolysin
MLPRTEVDFLPASLPLREAATVVTDKPHSRYPVMGDSSDDVVGFVHIRDIFDPSRSGSDVTIGDVAREVTAFPGTKEVLTTLTEMRRLRQHLAIVQDEYGGTAGIVTLEDLVEELIGDVQDEYDLAGADAAVPVSGEIVVGGLTNVSDFADDTGIELPDGPYETIAGFVVAQLGRVPTLGDGVELVGHTFEVTELDGLRISQVVVRPVASPSDGGGQDVADDGPQ